MVRKIRSSKILQKTFAPEKEVIDDVRKKYERNLKLTPTNPLQSPLFVIFFYLFRFLGNRLETFDPPLQLRILTIYSFQVDVSDGASNESEYG